MFLCMLVCLCVGKPTIYVPTRSDTNWSVSSQKIARSLKFWIKKVEDLYYPCSEIGNREADMRLCFRICRLLVFPCEGSFLMSCRVLSFQPRFGLKINSLQDNLGSLIRF